MANHIRHGKDKRGRRTAEELGRRETRLKKIREAKPKDKDQYNFTDPQSRIMPGANGMTQGYNAQAAVESRQAGVEESLP
jgi:hypothetical protein